MSLEEDSGGWRNHTMQFLNGTRTGEEILLLSTGREISRDNLWAIRFLFVVFIANTLFFEIEAYTGPDGLGTFASLLILLTPVYWLALRLASGSNETTGGQEVGE